MYFPTLIVMISSSLLYWFVAWYIEKVVPGQYGIAQRWNFLFKRSEARRRRTINRITPFPHSSSISLEPSAIVHVDRLTKEFGPDQIAVNDVSFDLYENEITSLLGPNGSGKTTIFNWLTGIY